MRRKITLDWLQRLAPVLGFGDLAMTSSKSDGLGNAAVTDLLAFLHFIRAEHRIDVPERHFETLRSILSNAANR